MKGLSERHLQIVTLKICAVGMGNTPCLTGIQVLPPSMANVSRDSYAAFTGKLEINKCQRIKTTRGEGEQNREEGRKRNSVITHVTAKHGAFKLITLFCNYSLVLQADSKRSKSNTEWNRIGIK